MTSNINFLEIMSSYCFEHFFNIAKNNPQASFLVDEHTFGDKCQYKKCNLNATILYTASYNTEMKDHLCFFHLKEKMVKNIHNKFSIKKETLDKKCDNEKCDSIDTFVYMLH